MVSDFVGRKVGWVATEILIMIKLDMCSFKRKEKSMSILVSLIIEVERRAVMGKLKNGECVRK